MSASKSALTCLIVLLAACNGDKDGGTTVTYPQLDLSSTRLDFETVDFGGARTRTLYVSNLGDLPMGVESIALGEDEMEGNFLLSYKTSEITCPSSSARTALAPETGGEGEGEGEGEATDTAAEAQETGTFVLEPGCKLPVKITMSPVTVGEIVSSVLVTTVSGEADGEDYYRDPDNTWRAVVMEGKGTKSGGNLITSPVNLDFGYVYEGEIGTEYIRLRNVGDADIVLGEASLDSDCAEGFSIVSAFDDGRILAGDSSTLIQVDFSPTDDEKASCSLFFTSDDEDDPLVEVKMEANQGDDPNNISPTAEIRTPDEGYILNGTAPLSLEINVFDPDQSADTLTCKIKSVILQKDTLADCTPADESGHVFVDIPLTDLEAGIDTILISVKDSSGAYGYASTTVLYKEGFPSSDDDGDGFGDDPTEENIDCDDEDPNVYPEAAEIADGKDNDCNGTIDEGTDGADDDGDGYSEEEGDCNDNSDETYPGAEELGDRADNDCDGVIDEGSSLFDDDGDDFSEAENDCDDDDPAINPTADEYCDGVDNDCNGLKDEQDGCIAFESDPIIIGGIQMGVTALGVGESTTMTAYVFDGDSTELSYSWEQDSRLTSLGHSAIDLPSASTITFTAPDELPEGSAGEVYTVFVVVLDESGNQDYEIGEITVYPRPVTLEYTLSSGSSGCGGSSAGLFLLPALAGLAGLSRRRRQQA